jgi:hypothetical protein
VYASLHHPGTLMVKSGCYYLNSKYLFQFYVHDVNDGEEKKDRDVYTKPLSIK